MKRTLLILMILGLAVSPLMVSKAEATPVKHGLTVKHHKNLVKKHALKRLTRRGVHKKAV